MSVKKYKCHIGCEVAIQLKLLLLYKLSIITIQAKKYYCYKKYFLKKYYKEELKNTFINFIIENSYRKLKTKIIVNVVLIVLLLISCYKLYYNIKSK